MNPASLIGFVICCFHFFQKPVSTASLSKLSAIWIRSRLEFTQKLSQQIPSCLGLRLWPLPPNCREQLPNALCVLTHWQSIAHVARNSFRGLWIHISQHCDH